MAKPTNKIENLNPKKILEMEDAEHKAYHRRMTYVLVVILIALFGGATFYYYIEKWSYIDALYFSAATMTTVGYGDITPKTFPGKIFTIIYVFAGVGIALYGLSLIASHFVEVREEFWLERLGNINIKGHTQTVWGKLRNLFNYKSESIVKSYEKSIKKK